METGGGGGEEGGREEWSRCEVVVAAAQHLGGPLRPDESLSLSYNADASVFLLLRQSPPAQGQEAGRTEARLVDGASDFSLSQPFALGPSDGPLRTASLPHTSLLVSPQHISFRRDFHGQLLLRTALDSGPKAPEDSVRLELLAGEAVKLIEFFGNSRDLLSPTAGRLLEQLESPANWASQGKWDSVVVEAPLDDLLVCFREYLAELSEKHKAAGQSPAGGVGWGAAPLLASLLEKASLYQSRPYRLGGMEDKTSMGSEAARRLTFAGWPHMHYKWALPSQMAEAGFFHQSNQTGDDRVNCFACTVCLVCWEPSDEPWSEHERHSPNCPFVAGLPTTNVPIALTQASLPAIAHKLPLLSPEALDQLVLGTVSRAAWFPVLTSNGLVQLWHLQAVPKQAHEFPVSLSDPFIGMKTGYLQGPRKPNRVTWSDNPGEDAAAKAGGSQAKDSTQPPTSSSETGGGSAETKPVLKRGEDRSAERAGREGEMRVRAASVVGRDLDDECSPALVLGIELDEERLFPAKEFQSLGMESSEEAQLVQALNSVNSVHSQSPPRISPALQGSGKVSDSSTPIKPAQRHFRPFILVYKIDESLAEEGGSDVGGPGDGPGRKRRTTEELSGASESAAVGTGGGEPSGSLQQLLMSEAIEDMEEEMELCGDASTLSGDEDQAGSAYPHPSSSLHPSHYAMDHAITLQGWNKAFEPDPAEEDAPQLTYTAPSAGLVVLQCFRLPGAVDEVDWEFEALLPSTDGRSLVVVLKRAAAFYAQGSKGPTNAVLTYTLSFSGLMTGLDEEPRSLHFFGGDSGDGSEALGQPCLVSAEALCLSRRPSDCPSTRGPRSAPGEPDVVVAISDGRLVLLDLATGLTLHRGSAQGPRLRTLAKGPVDRVCAVGEDGSVSILQLFAGPHKEDEEEAIDGAAPTFRLSGVPETHLQGQGESRATLVEPAGDTEAVWPHEEMSLEEAWGLVGRREERRSEQSFGKTGGADAVSVRVPNSWSELAQHQRLRKNPQHYLREEKSARWWVLSPEEESWRQQSLELTLSRSVSADHMDLRFYLHPSCLGVPGLTLSLYKREFMTRGPAAPSAGVGTEAGGDEEAAGELIFGPVHLSDAMGVSGLEGLVQIAHPILQSSVWRRLSIQLRAEPADDSRQRLWKLAREGHAGRTAQKSRSPTEPTAAGPSKGLDFSGGPYPLSHFLSAPPDGSGQSGHPSLPPPLPFKTVGGGSGSGTMVMVRAGTPSTSTTASSGGVKTERRGLDWIQEVSLSLSRSSASGSGLGPSRARSRRVSILRNAALHGKILQALAGGEGSEESQSGQVQAFDVASWLFAHWRSPSFAVLAREFAKALGPLLKALVRHCYILGDRSSGHKATAFLADLGRLLLQHERASGARGEQSFLELQAQLVEAVEAGLGQAAEAASSGALTWLFGLASQLLRTQPALCGGILAATSHILSEIGEQVPRRSTALARSLRRDYGVTSEPGEAELWEWLPSNMTKTAGPERELDWAQVLGVELSTDDGPGKGPVGQGPPKLVASAPLAALPGSSGAAASSYWASFHANASQNNLPLPDFAASYAGLPKQSKGDASAGKRELREKPKSLLSREHLCGLLETEPLSFVCVCASDGVRLESSPAPAPLSLAPTTGSTHAQTHGPIALPQLITQGGDGGNEDSSASVVKAHVQTILSKQMQLLALQQEKQKLEGKLAEVGKDASGDGLGLHGQHTLGGPDGAPGTQNSSASTFGVPTTPKTTPFMTPTPLSPSHLSPMNSQTNLAGLEGLEELREELGDGADGHGDRGKLSAALNLLPKDLLKPQAPQSLLVEKMNSGARKWVTLDFGRGVLLTDLVVPACADLCTLTVDVWREGEAVDGQRLIVSSQIGDKALVVSDLQPPAFCRYLKITYIGRQGLSSSAPLRIPLGGFFGHRFFRSRDLRLWVPREAAASHRQPLSGAQLGQLLEDVSCRHRSALDQLKDLVEARAEAAPVLAALRVAREHQLHRSLIRRLLGRLEPAERAAGPPRGWAGASLGQLSFSGQLALGLLVRSGPFTQILHGSTHVALAQPLTSPEMGLEDALRCFRQLCMGTPPCLAALGAAWVFGRCGHAAFFGEFLARMVGEAALPSESLLLAFLTAQALRGGNQAVMTELLEALLRSVEGLGRRGSAEELEGILSLLSVSLDMATLTSSSTRRSRLERWGFLSGGWTDAGLPGDSPTDPTYRKRLLRNGAKISNKLKWEDSIATGFSLMDQQYQKTLELAEDIKAFVGGKSGSSRGLKSKKPPSGASVSGSSGKRSKSSTHQHSSSRSSGKKSSGSREKWSSLKLRIPWALGLRVGKALTGLLLRQSQLVSPSTQLLGMKTLSRVCTGTTPLQLGLARLLSQEELAELLERASGGWVRQGLQALILDLLEAEARALRKEAERRAAQHSERVMAQLRGAAMQGPSQELGARGSSLPPEPSAGLAEGPSGSSGQQTPQTPTPGSVTPSPDTPAGAKALIDGYVASVALHPVPNSKVEDKTRLKYLRLAAREMVDINLESGQAFEDMKNWLAETAMHEAQLAAGSASPSAYKARMAKYLEVQKNSHSAAGFLGSYYPPGGVFHSGLLAQGQGQTLAQSFLPTSGELLSLGQGLVDDAVFPSLFAPAAQSTAYLPAPLPSLPLSTTTAQLLHQASQSQPSQAKDHLSSSAHKQAEKTSSDLPPSPTQSGGKEVGEDEDAAGEERDAGGEASASGGESAGPQVPSGTERDPDDSAKDKPSLLQPQFQLPPASQVKLLSLELETQRAVEQFCPVSLVMEERADGRLGWAGEAEARAWLLRDDATLRATLIDFLPLVKPQSAHASHSQTITDIPRAPTTLQILSSVISREMEGLEAGLSGAEAVERVVGLAWTVAHGACEARSWSSSSGDDASEARLELSQEAVGALLALLASDSQLLSPQTWVTAVRLLTHLSSAPVTSSRDAQAQGPQLVAQLMVRSAAFPALLGRFVAEGSEVMGGPAFVGALSGLLSRLRIFCDVRDPSGSSATQHLREAVLGVLVDVAKNLGAAARGSLGVSVDVFSVCVEFLNGQDLEGLETGLLAEAVGAFAAFASAFVRHSAPVPYPQLGGPAPTGGLNPRFCFVLSPAASPNQQLKSLGDRAESVLTSLLSLASSVLLPEESRPAAPPPLSATPPVGASPSPTALDGRSLSQPRSAGPLASSAEPWVPADEGQAVVARLLQTPAYLASLLGALEASFAEVETTERETEGWAWPEEDFPGLNGKESLMVGGKPRSPLTVADWTAHLLGASVNAWARDDSGELGRRGTDLLVSLLRKSLRGRSQDLSEPSLAFLKALLSQPSHLAHFVDAGGCDLLNEALTRALRNSGEGGGSLGNKEAGLLRRIGSVAGQVMASGKWKTREAESSGTPKVEGMCNFSPNSSISSSSPMAHHLQALISASPANRRARTPAWTYHFYPAELWLDLTLALPQPVILREIHLKPHIPALQTGPSAVQVELGGDWNPASLQLLGPPLPTTGASKIRISTAHFPGLVHSVKIHLRRPSDSANMGLVQILLLGHSPQSAFSEGLRPAPSPPRSFPVWLRLLSSLLHSQPSHSVSLTSSSGPAAASVVSVAARLSESLSASLLRALLTHQLSSETSGELSAVLRRLGESQGPAHMLVMVATEVAEGCGVREASLPWLLDVVWALCSRSAFCPDAWWPLAESVMSVLESDRLAGPLGGRLLRLLACLAWRAEQEPPKQKLQEMAKRVALVASQSDGTEARSQDWPDDVPSAAAFFLGALLRLSEGDGLILASLDWLGLPQLAVDASREDPEKLSAPGPSKSVGPQLGALEAEKVKLLEGALGSRRGGEWLVRSGALLGLCERTGRLLGCSGRLSLSEEREALALCGVLASLTEVPCVQSWFATSAGVTVATKLFDSLSGGSLGVGHVWPAERLLIQLFQNLLLGNQLHQELFSQMLRSYMEVVSGARGLSGSLQATILFTLLSEETVEVLVSEDGQGLLGSVTRTNNSLPHPRYGCSARASLLRVSVTSTAADLLGGFRRPAPGPPLLSLPSSSTTAFKAFSSVTSAYSHSSAQPSAPTSSAEAMRQGREVAEAVLRSRRLQLSCKHLSSAPLPGSMSLGQVLLGGRDSEGRIELSLSSGLAKVQAKEDLSLSLAPSPKSSLEIFAEAGGLACLAQHLQLYHPQGSLGGREGGEGESGEGPFADPYFDPFEFIDAAGALPEQIPQSAFSAAGYGVPYPLGTVTTAPDGFGDSAGLGSFEGSGPSAGVPVSGKGHSLGAQLVRTSGAESALWPHVTLSLALFLRLPGYAQLLVAQDQRKARKLLRLAMGLSHAPCLALSSGSQEGSEDSGSAWLFLLPFSVLSKLYASAGPGSTEGRALRSRSMEMGIPQLLLTCLAAFSHTEPRREDESGQVPEMVGLLRELVSWGPGGGPLTASPGPTSSGRGDERAGPGSAHYWAKGTGFGTGSTAQHWNIELYNVRRRQDEQNVAALLSVLANFIQPLETEGRDAKAKAGLVAGSSEEETLTEEAESGTEELVRLVEGSAVIPLVLSYLRNDSVLDMGRHVGVYEAVLSLLNAVALVPSLGILFVRPQEASDGHGSEQSVWALLQRLRDCMLVYVSKLKKERGEGPGDEEEEEAREATDSSLIRLVPMAERAAAALARLADAQESSQGSVSAALAGDWESRDLRYVGLMKPEQFQSVAFFEEGGGTEGKMAVAFHYESSLRSRGMDVGGGRRTRRLAQEAVTLSTSLPLSASSSVFVRTAEERLDLMKVLITGPADTPYANGCFVFDVFFPADYPTSPMNINLETTGGGSVRFNPNLYNDGKVCLSVLNTWHGRPEERWNGSTSSFLQVLVSIQSLILVSEPYFNEPGYERSRSTAAGQAASLEYDANLRQATVKWAMLEALRDALRCPAKPFSSVVHLHFWLKRDEVLAQVQGWISQTATDVRALPGAQAVTSGAGSASSSLLLPSAKHSSRNVAAHLAQLQRHFADLQAELAHMPPPPQLKDAPADAPDTAFSSATTQPSPSTTS